ncbi:Smr/MutS family protein [Sphingomonas sp. Leaf357]|uniref:Smr/MutS family protein n=1 Tax=Sphingomonas sp. Leaf357 TaxID=1736350 RepID=UPI000A3FB2D8
MWDRVLATVRPLRVAPKPVAKVAAAKVAVVKPAAKTNRVTVTHTAQPSGKVGAGVGSSAVDLFEKLLKLGVGGIESPKHGSAARPHPNPASGEQRPALFRSSRGDDRPDAPKAEGHRKQQAHNTLDGSWDKKLSRGLVSPDCSIDLHGHNLSTAYATLDGALEQSIRMGDRVVLLVTGKPPRAESERPHARGAIRAAIGDWLAGSRHASAIAAVRGAHPRHGGAGALYIILRRNDPNRIY